MITEINLTPRRLTLLSEMEITSLYDLINYYPKKYDDLNVTKLTKELDDKRVVCVGKVYSEVKQQRLRFLSQSSGFSFSFEECQNVTDSDWTLDVSENLSV